MTGGRGPRLSRRRYVQAAGLGVVSLAGVRNVWAAGGDEIWRFQTGDGIGSSPTVVDGTVFVGSDDGNVYALEAEDGTEQWRFQTSSSEDETSSVSSSPTVVDGTVFVGSGDGHVYALDASTGTEQWRFQTKTWGSWVHSSPTVVDGVVFFGSIGFEATSVYALYAGEGTEQWRFQTGGGVWSSPTVVDGTVFAGSDDGHVYALDASAGTEQWRFQTGSGVNSSPTVVDGTVFVGSDDSNVYALDASDGTEQWRFQTDDWVSSSPTVVDETVFVGSDDGNVYALDAGDGSEQWHFPTARGIKSSPTALDGTVFIGSDHGHVYAFDAVDGTIQWQFHSDRAVFSSPTVVDGTVFVGSHDQNLYALDAGVSVSGEGSRVMLGTLGHHGGWRYAGQSIRITDPPTASITVATPVPRTGKAVTFDASGSSDPDGTITAYEWFIYGTTYTGQTVEHTFQATGTYTVELTVTDDSGVTDTTSREVTVYKPPTAAITLKSQSPAAGDSVTFDASSSSDPDGTITSYEWSIDGTIYTGRTAEHIFQAAGTYTVELTVTNDEGVTATTSREVTVQKPPRAVITLDPPSPAIGTGVTFDASGSSDPDGTITAYEWSVDGTTYTGQTVEYTFQTAGTYTVALTVTDDDGATATTSWELRVSEPPTAAITLSPSSPTVGTAVTFDASRSSDPDGTITAYEWSIEGASYTGQTVEHTFQAQATHTVELTVTDDDGATDTTRKKIYVDQETASDETMTTTPDWAIATDRPQSGDSRTTPSGSVSDLGTTATQTLTTSSESTDLPLLPVTVGAASLFAGVTGLGAYWWHSSPVEAAPVLEEWPLVARTPESANAAASHSPVTPTGTPAWMTDLSPAGRPVLADECLYLGTTDGDLVAVDARSGDRQWTVSVGDQPTTTPAVEFGMVYAASGTSVVGIDTDTGDQRWATTLVGPAVGPPIAADDRLYVASDDGVVALLAKNGQTAWTTDDLGAIDRGVAVGADRVVVATEDGTVVGLDDDTGAQRWQVSLDVQQPSAPTIVDRTALVADGMGTVVAIDAFDGTIEWTTGQWGRGIDRVAATSETVWLAGDDGYVVALDTGASTEDRERWRQSLQVTPVDGPVVLGETVYVAGRNGVVGLDATTGEERWRFQASGLSGLVPTSDALYLSTEVRLQAHPDEDHDGSWSEASARGEGDQDGVADAAGAAPDEAAPGDAVSDPPAVADHPDDSVPASSASPPALEADVSALSAVRPLDTGGAVCRYGATHSDAGAVTVLSVAPEVEDTAAREAFQQATAGWRSARTHPNVVDVHDHGSEPRPWVAIDAGQTETSLAGVWEDLLTEHKLTVIEDTGEALRNVALYGTNHLDIRPACLYLTHDGDDLTVRVGDWGLDRRVQTALGEQRITPYTAPEQVGEGQTDRRTDVYALGAVAYYILTGVDPVAAEAAAIRRGEVTPPSERGAPPALDDPILRALSVDPAERFDSPSTFATVVLNNGP